MVECELCGRPIVGRAYKIYVEGAELTVCNSCYIKVMSRKSQTRAEVVGVRKPAITRTYSKPKSPIRRTSRRTPSLDMEYEVVEDYAQRIRRAREKLGWSLSILAQKVREKESVLRRIEQGRLTPPIDLARRLEKILGIKLLEPTVEEHLPKRIGDKDLTLGDIVVIRKKGEK